MHEDMLDLLYYINWKLHPYIETWQPLAPIVEHYSQHHLLLQRDVLILHRGEERARHNTLQHLFKKCLENVWLPKASFMSYEVLFITKGGVTLDIPLCHPWTTLMTLQLHYITHYITDDYFHSTNETWNFTLHLVYKNTFSTYTHVGQK